MDDTIVDGHNYMHAQEKNTHGRIFGGFLMNKAFNNGYLSVQQLIEDSLVS